MHYYQHHIGDFIKATSRLSDGQAMAYLRLLWMYYDTEKPLKPDTKVLAFQIGATVEETELLLESFFVLHENGWHHTRCDQEIAEYRTFLEKKSNAGRASAERRKHNSSTTVEQVLNECSTDVQLTTNQQPLTNKPKREKKGASAEIVFPDGLDQMAWAQWIEYRKLSGKALKPISWQSAIDSLVKHGPNQMAVVNQSIANGWQGLFALKQDGNKNQSMTFAERDAAAGRKRWEEMTGRKWPENETWIDAETFTLEIDHDITDQSR